MGIDMEEIYEQGLTLDSKLFALGMFLILSVIFTILAAMVFIAICKNEGKEEHVLTIFTKRPQEKTRLVTVSGWMGIAICIFMMFGLAPLARLLGF